jgi:four helix bundle protein
VRDFRQLSVWEKSHLLALAVYRSTSRFPVAEQYGLTSQLRRCATSVPSNIAEGCGRDTEADFARFLTMALGSASELEYQLIPAHDLGYLASTEHGQLSTAVVEVKKMLGGLLARLKADL